MTFILDKMAPGGGWRGTNARTHARARVCSNRRPKRDQIPGWPPQVSQAGRLGTHLTDVFGKNIQKYVGATIAVKHFGWSTCREGVFCLFSITPKWQGVGMVRTRRKKSKKVTNVTSAPCSVAALLYGLAIAALLYGFAVVDARARCSV